MSKKRTSTEAARAARMIRKHLKDNGVAAKVRSSNYSGGSSINVYLDDPLPATVEAVESYVDGFKYGDFDGMTDSYNYRKRGDDLRPRVSFVFVNAEYSDELKAEAKAYFEANYDVELFDSFEREHGMPYRILRGSEETAFWRTRKPRVRVAEAA